VPRERLDEVRGVYRAVENHERLARRLFQFGKNSCQRAPIALIVRGAKSPRHAQRAVLHTELDFPNPLFAHGSAHGNARFAIHRRPVDQALHAL